MILSIDEVSEIQGAAQLDERFLDMVSARNGKRGLSAGSKRSYLPVIRQYNQFLLENGMCVGLRSLKAYFAWLEEIGQKASTLNHKRFALAKVIRAQFAQDSITRAMTIEKALQQIPTYQTDKKIRPGDVLAEEQVRQLMEACRTDKTRLLIHFLYKTGCRVSEMINIRFSDCTQSNHVRIRVMGKGEREREVTIPRSLFNAIRNTYQGKTWLFETRRGRQLDRTNVHAQIQRVGKRIGQNVHPHTLRHSRATDVCINKKWSLKATSNLLGHSEVAITADMYLHDVVDFDKLFDQDTI